MNKPCIYLFLCLSILFFNNQVVSGQTWITANAGGSYWQHTELAGFGVGMGLERQIEKWKISLNYEYGYGSYHRFKKFDNINYDYWTTVLVDEDKWSSSPGLNDPINEMKAKSDYGKQHQLSLKLHYSPYKKENCKLNIGAGIYASVVEHFFTFTDTIVYYLDITPFYRGPLNYIPVSHQRFLTYGASFEFSWDFIKPKRVWTPYISAGLGPRYSSFLSAGLRLSTKLMRKK